METIRKYLDDEATWVQATRDFYVVKLEEELAKLRTEFKDLSDNLANTGGKDIVEVRKMIEDAEKGLDMEGEITDIWDDWDGWKSGIKLTFNKLISIATHRPLKIFAEFYIDRSKIFDEFGNPAMYNTVRSDDHCPEDGRRPRKIPTVDAIFGDTHYCIKHFPGLLEFYKGEKDCFILFTIYECEGDTYLKSKKKYPPSYILREKRILIGWKLVKVNRSDLSLKQGRYKDRIFRPPLQKPPFEERNEKDLKQHTIDLDYTLEIFKYNNANRHEFAYRRFKKKKRKEKVIEEEVDLRPFIPNDIIPYIDKQFEKGSGVDFYVDSARYLPSSCTVTKIMTRIVDSNIVDLVDPESKISDLNSTVFAPYFDFRTEIRFPFFNPTTMIIIMLLTCDNRDPDSCASIVGYGFFPLFISNITGKQPEDMNEKNFCLRNGHYQIPIFAQEYYQKKPFLHKDQQFLDKLPCGTLLIRCRVAPKDGFKVLGIYDIAQKEWAEKGVWPPAPPYHKGVYFNSECDVNASESELFEILRFRHDPIIAEKAVSLAYKLGVTMNPDMDTQEIEEILYKMIDNQLRPSSRTDILDLKYLAVYNPKAGFKVCIDG